MNEKKYKAIVGLWGFILLVLQAITLINVIGIMPEAYTDVQKIIISIIAILVIALVIIFMVLSLRKKKAGPIIGMIIGVAYIISLNVVNLIVGICLIISSADLLKDLNNDAATPKKEQEENKKVEDA